MKVLITCGDTNGIGPEIALRALQTIWEKKKEGRYILIIPRSVFTLYYDQLSCTFPLSDGKSGENTPCTIELAPVKGGKMHLGRPTKHSGQAALASLAQARALLKLHKDSVLVTAPIAKEACTMAGSEFHGHTEMLASWDNTNQFMMIFSSKAMRGGLLTIHEPLRIVPKLLTRKLFEEKIAVATQSLHLDFGIKKPTIAVLGLNPHAGENGILGTEELLIFNAMIAKLGLSGPFPADAFFANRAYRNFDFVLSPYHDQLLIPFKMLSWKDGVNFTAGLSFIRTSPDHGVAYDIAGKGKANSESMYSAIQLAKKIYQNRKKYS